MKEQHGGYYCFKLLRCCAARGATDSFFIQFFERIKGNKTEKMPRKARKGGKRW